jgi:hypothetical protein
MICVRGTNLLGLYLPGIPSVSIHPAFRHAQILLTAEPISVHPTQLISGTIIERSITFHNLACQYHKIQSRLPDRKTRYSGRGTTNAPKGKRLLRKDVVLGFVLRKNTSHVSGCLDLETEWEEFVWGSIPWERYMHNLRPCNRDTGTASQSNGPRYRIQETS